MRIATSIPKATWQRVSNAVILATGICSSLRTKSHESLPSILTRRRPALLAQRQVYALDDGGVALSGVQSADPVDAVGLVDWEGAEFEFVVNHAVMFFGKSDGSRPFVRSRRLSRYALCALDLDSPSFLDMARYEPDYSDEPDWQCGCCGQSNLARWQHCRNCKEPKPERDRQELLEQVAREHPRDE